MDSTARNVLRGYTGLHPIRELITLGNRGGFSGASLWRVECALGPVCLRAWPAEETTPERLEFIHSRIKEGRKAGLWFVPELFLGDRAETWVHRRDRFWDVTTWMLGRADFQECPTSARLEAACKALAEIHLAWRTTLFSPDKCPAVLRRFCSALDWLNLVESGWRPTFTAGEIDPVQPPAVRAWLLLRGRGRGLLRQLTSWYERVFPLQPCLCDIWHDHVLFQEDRVTGIIDYGSTKIDNVAVDLARLLGSMAGDDATLRAAGLKAYSQARVLSPEEESLIPVLDETGVFLGAANWLRWIYRDGRVFEDRERVARRLTDLVERIERMA